MVNPFFPHGCAVLDFDRIDGVFRPVWLMGERVAVRADLVPSGPQARTSVRAFSIEFQIVRGSKFSLERFSLPCIWGKEGRTCVGDGEECAVKAG